MNGVLFYSLRGQAGLVYHYSPPLLPAHSSAGLRLLHEARRPIDGVAPCKAGTDGVTPPHKWGTMRNGNPS